MTTVTQTAGSSVIAAALVLGSALLQPQAAISQIRVDVPGQGTWDIGSFGPKTWSNVTDAEKTELTGQQWFGNESLARAFGNAWLAEAKAQNLTEDYAFVLTISDTPGNLYTLIRCNPNLSGDCFGVDTQSSENALDTFAIATRVPESVPGPLPVFGAAAAFGTSRRLRKRLRDSKPSVVTND